METLAKILSSLVAVGVVVVGIAAMGGDWTVDDPKTTTTVVSAAVGKGERAQKTTTVTTRHGGRVARTTKTVEATPGRAAQPAKRVTTTVAGGKTVIERVLGDGGLVMLRLGAIVLAAFLAAAIVQRVVLGEYAITVGGLELPAVAAGKAAEGLDAVSEKIDAIDGARQGDAAQAKADLAVLYARLAALEQRVAQL